MKSLGSQRLNEMTLEELSRDLFGKVLAPKEALHFANSFKKALISERRNALKSWFSKNLTEDEKIKLEKQNPELSSKAAQ